MGRLRIISQPIAIKFTNNYENFEKSSKLYSISYIYTYAYTRLKIVSNTSLALTKTNYLRYGLIVMDSGDSFIVLASESCGMFYDYNGRCDYDWGRSVERDYFSCFFCFPFQSEIRQFGR